MKLSCSIVSYRHSSSIIKTAVESVLKSWPNSRIVVIDNYGDDDLAYCCVEWGVEYKRSEVNLGFGKAHNLVLNQTKGLTDFHLVLNPDVRFGKHVLPELIAKYCEIPNCGLLSPLILYPNRAIQHLCKLVPTPMDLIIRRLIPGAGNYLWKKRIEQYEMRNFNYQDSFFAPILSGCFLLFSDEVYQKVGGFDERFFLYLEDVDLSRRMAQSHLNVHWPSVAITHDYQKSSYHSLKPLLHHIISAIKYFNKWGWIFDQERKQLNRTTLNQKKPYSPHHTSQR